MAGPEGCCAAFGTTPRQWHSVATGRLAAGAGGMFVEEENADPRLGGGHRGGADGAGAGGRPVRRASRVHHRRPAALVGTGRASGGGIWRPARASCSTRDRSVRSPRARTVGERSSSRWRRTDGRKKQGAPSWSSSRAASPRLFEPMAAASHQVALDPTGTIAATGGEDGVIRVGPAIRRGTPPVARS